MTAPFDRAAFVKWFIAAQSGRVLADGLCFTSDAADQAADAVERAVEADRVATIEADGYVHGCALEIPWAAAAGQEEKP